MPMNNDIMFVWNLTLENKEEVITAVLLGAAIVLALQQHCKRRAQGQVEVGETVVCETAESESEGMHRELLVRQRWKQALQYVLRILRMRKHSPALGAHLSCSRIQDLTQGSERKHGKLQRASNPTAQSRRQQ